MTIHLKVPDGLLLATGQTEEELAEEARFLLALELFEVGRLSSGRAAELADMPLVELLLRAGRMGVAVAALEGDELDMEFSDAASRAGRGSSGTWGAGVAHGVDRLY